MVELHWPRRATFTDVTGDGETVRYGQGTHDVPEAKVETFRDRGWEQPPEEQDESAPAAVEQEAEPDADESDADGFDADGFVSESWQSVVAAVEDGEVDGNLDAVQAAEQDRDGEPRSSVIEAIEARK